MNPKHITLILLLALLLAACAPKATPMPTPDIGAIQTAAAKTVIAEIYATAAAAASLTPLASPTLEPTFAAPTVTVTMTVVVLTTPGVIGTSQINCNVYKFIDDVNYRDGEVVTPGQEFIKTWKIQNSSPCTWGAGYQVVYGGYTDKMRGVPLPLPSIVAPGETIEVSVQFKAPTKPGEYVSAWTLATPQGIPFHDERGKPFYIKIIVR